jgi:HEAT repeat protein
MLIDTPILALCAIGLLCTLVLLVLAKRVARGRAERRSRRRRVAWVAAVGTGSVTDIRMRDLRSLARGAARGAAPQEDLLSLLSAGRLPPRDDRREPFRRAIRRSGLTRALRRSLRSRNAASRGRAALLWAHLGLHGGERLIAPLITDPDPDVRAAATQALGYCESGDAAWALLRALREGHVEPARAAERLTGPWAVGPLLQALHEPAFADVRPWLAEALGLTRDERGEAPLARLLTTGDEEERIRAARALGRIARESSATALVAALTDDSPVVRSQAARAIVEVRERGSIGALVRLLGDDSWWARARAAEALASLGTPGLAALRWCASAHPDLYARERAAEALSSDESALEEVAVA